ncbi:hypothetical protein [Sphingomonas sp. T9W2]|uniref:hypothetical protein n=1 Tax=Sphingomonas sp. T9W2 TaxID=3143183 RepID=UPI0031F49B45
MANAIKGEVPFTAAGGSFMLLYDFNALCTIEQDLEIDVADIGSKLSSASMLRSVFRIGLEAHHGAMSDIEAGRLIHDLGVEQAGEIIGKAFKAAFPDAAKGDGEGNVPAPKKPGTGRKR